MKILDVSFSFKHRVGYILRVQMCVHRPTAFQTNLAEDRMMRANTCKLPYVRCCCCCCCHGDVVQTTKTTKTLSYQWTTRLRRQRSHTGLVEGAVPPPPLTTTRYRTIHIRSRRLRDLRGNRETGAVRQPLNADIWICRRRRLFESTHNKSTWPQLFTVRTTNLEWIYFKVNQASVLCVRGQRIKLQTSQFTLSVLRNFKLCWHYLTRITYLQ